VAANDAWGAALRYFVMIVPKHEQYIEGLPISNQAKLLISKFITAAIGGVSDEFREAHRPKAGKPYFQTRLDFRDWWGDNLDHVVDFVVKDDRAEVGVLELVWVDFQ
jgi:hypothetical protein